MYWLIDQLKFLQFSILFSNQGACLWAKDQPRVFFALSHPLRLIQLFVALFLCDTDRQKPAPCMGENAATSNEQSVDFSIALQVGLNTRTDGETGRHEPDDRHESRFRPVSFPLSSSSTCFLRLPALFAMSQCSFL
mmetsp:Transcript_29786/g.58448  ORF Transcript_29786/g.58448 Transcript_29786/m.58448 type:complete len:136 (-) Transcript_29786:226-633(-)